MISNTFSGAVRGGVAAPGRRPEGGRQNPVKNLYNIWKFYFKSERMK